MKFTPAKSSNVKEWHYDEGTKTLTVRYLSGGEYKYGGVAKEHADGLASAESIGKYIHKHIKSADYKFVKS